MVVGTTSNGKGLFWARSGITLSVPNGQGLRYLKSSTRAPVGAVFSPSQVPQLVAAWAGDIGVTGGGSNVAGAYGTSNSLSVPSGGTAPTVDSTGIEGNAALVSPGGSVKILKSASDIVLTGDFTIYATGRADHTSSTRTLFGRDTNNQEALRVPVTDGVTNAVPTVRVCATAAYSIALGRPIVPGCHVWRFSRVADVLTVWLDGEQIGSQAGHTGNSTWSSLGYNSTGANTWQGLMGEVLVLDESVSAVSAQNQANLYSYLEYRWRSKFYMNGTSGSDSNDGSTPGRARKTLSALNALPFRDGQRYWLTGRYAADAVYFDTTTTTASSSSSRPWRIIGDPASPPVIEQSTVVPGPWISMGGGIYKTTIALTLETSDGEYVMAGRVTSGGVVTRIYTGTSTTPTLNHQFYDGTDLYLNVGADPTTMTVEVAQRGTMSTTYTNAAVRLARPFIQVDGVTVGMFPGNSFRIGHANGGIWLNNCSGTYGALDGVNISAGYQAVTNVQIYYPGRRWDGSGSAGDTLTAHGTSGAFVSNFLGVGGGKGGIANEQAVVMDVYDSVFTGCYLPVIVLAQGTAGTGRLVMSRCEVERPIGAGQDDAAVLQAGLPVGNTVAITATDFTGQGPTRGKAINNLGGVILSESNNTQTGFNSMT